MRMKAIASTHLLCLVLFVNAAFAQISPVDSLKKVLAQPMPDTARVLTLDQLSLRLMYSKPVVAMQYSQEGLDLAEKINFPRGKVRNMNRLGSILRFTSNYAEALEMHFNALKIAEKIDYQEGVARTLNNIGILYSEQKDSKKAIEYYFKTKVIAEKINDQNLLQISLVNLGTDYALLNQTDSARFYTEAAYEMAVKRKSSNVPVLLMNLGNIYNRMGNYPLSLQYYRSALPYLKAADNNRLLSQTYFEMAQVFKARKRLDSCQYYAKKSLALSQEVNNTKYIYEAGMLLASLYESNDKAQAYDYFKLAAVAKDSIFSEEKTKQIQNLGLNEQLRQQELSATRKEFENQRRMYLLFGVMGVILIVMVILYRNNIQKNRANELLHKQKEAIQTQKKQLQTSLETLKNTQAQLIQREKLASLGELTTGIAHEIQNPLNFVNNFADISVGMVQELMEIKEEVKLRTNSVATVQTGGELPPDIKAQNEEDEILEMELLGSLEKTLQKVTTHGQRASDIVKSMLEHSRTGTGEPDITNINKIVDEYLRLAFHGMKAKYKNFNSAYEFVADENLPDITVVPQDIGRVMMNLCNNAFYSVNFKANQTSKQNDGMMAVLATYQPNVTVITKKGKDMIEIHVKDNGTGIADNVRGKIFQPFFTTKPTGEGAGLGLSLSYDIVVKGHGGTIDVETVEGEGATFIVKLPIKSFAEEEKKKAKK